MTQKLQYITKMTVGEKILLKRTHLRYTQQGMAKMLNVKATLNIIETKLAEK